MYILRIGKKSEIKNKEIKNRGPLSCCFILHEPTTQHANGPGIKFWAAAAAANRMDEEDLNLNRKNK